MRTLTTTTTTTTTTSGTTPPRRRKAPLSSSSSSRRRDHHHHRAISNPENYNDVQKKAAAGKATNESKGEKKKKNARVSLVGLGCPKNVVDAEVMLGDMRKNGYDVTENHEDADAIIINSCGFIDDAKSESVEAILEASKLSGGKKKIVVTGCLAQRYGEDLQKELPEVDLIVGFENYGMLPSLVEESLRERDDESRIVSPFDPASQKRSGSATGTMSKNIITNDDLVLPKKKTLVGGNSPPFRSEIDRVRITPKHSAY